MLNLRHGAGLAAALVGVAALQVAGVEPSPPDPKPVGVIVRFHDGTTLHRAYIQDSVEIVTKYGKLTVPFADIRRVDFGLRTSAENSRKLEQALSDLGGNNFARRERASKDLLALGRFAYPALLALGQDKEKSPELNQRVVVLLDRIREAVPEEELRTEAEDVIHTRKCVLSGRIESTVFKGKSESLGDLELKLSEIRSIHASDSEAKVTVNAAKYGAADDQWQDTGFEAEADTDLLIIASGRIDLNLNAPNQGPAGFLSDPEGHPNLRSQTIAANVGTLLGRIGEKGELFLIGQRYDGRPKQAGKLYLHIVSMGQQVEGYKPTGSYNVRMYKDPAAAEKGKDLLIRRTPVPGGVTPLAPPPVPLPWPAAPVAPPAAPPAKPADVKE
jgi:hypothetical protein